VKSDVTQLQKAQRENQSREIINEGNRKQKKNGLDERTADWLGCEIAI